MILRLLIALGSAFALGHCLFLGLYCWQTAHKRPALRWLAGLLLALAIRLSKSVFIILVPNNPFLVPATGLIGMTLIGPFLWLYTREGLQPGCRFIRQDYLHFVPSAVVATWQFFVPPEGVIFGQYTLAAAHMAAYTGWSARAIQRKSVQTPIDPPVAGWLTRLCGGSGLIWLVFVGQLFAPRLEVYVAITLMASIVLYGISFWGLRQARSLTLYFVTTPVANEQLLTVGQQIKQVLSDERLYKDPTLTLQKLARRLKLPAHLTSKALNQTFDKTFPELLTGYRVRAVAQCLTDPAFAHFSMEAIGTECGFNSLSTFYTAFKKVYQMTPAQYQKRCQGTAAKSPG